MDNYLLPATRYEPPVWQVRKHVLNTIIEDEHSEDEEGSYTEEDPDDRGRTGTRNSISSRSDGSSSPVPSLTSSISSYHRRNRRSREFDELYDVSEDESIEDRDIIPSKMTYSMSMHTELPKPSFGPKGTRNKYPSIVIPSSRHWPSIQKLQKISPMISPARPPKIPLSPAVLSLLARDLPSSSQPPSLDGSLISDPLACSTAPVTPDMQNHPESGKIWGQVEITQRPNSNIFHKSKEPEFDVHDEDWDHVHTFGFEEGTIVRDFGCDSPVLGTEDNVSETGVQLPVEALRTLQHLSLEIPIKPESVTDTESVGEMQEVPFGSVRRRTVDMTPISQTSEYSLDQLSIPSPGGFFSSLGSNARHTWCAASSRPASAIPPSTTTAEYFYNCPWNLNPQATVEQIIEVDDTSTEGPPTARQIPLALPVPERVLPETPQHPQVAATESVHDYDEDYELGIQQAAENSLDRTSIWLAAQSSYMAALRETNPVNEIGLDSLNNAKRGSRHMRNDSLDSPMKKAVRFLESESAKHDKPNPNSSHQGDSIYYHAFQHISNKTESQDAFTHRQARSDAVQASRNCLPHEHLDRLQGNYTITSTDRPMSSRPISMFPGKDLGENEQTVEQKVISRVERERQALEQLNTSMWVVEASKFLSGGKLLNSPAVKDLAYQSHLSDPASMRILDLGGLPSCDWAWHCSREYPNSKVYTVTTESHFIDPSIRGPSNHRCVLVSKLWELPYPDHHFDSISARSLFTHLKNEKPLKQAADEYDLCLHECLRCLKPGGYLEFFLLDSEIVNAGSRGTAVSVEFGFNLKTRGYDPVPTKNWLGRLRRAGFDDIKRAWTFLPMGAPQKQSPLLPETPPPDVATYDSKRVEAIQGPVGSTDDAANVAGLVGSWTWEQWVLKLQIEMGKEQFLEGVGAVLEEGKLTGAGWRCLSGWARKPVDELVD